MSDGIQFGTRMSDADALMWNVERDPYLRSTITVVWVLDAEPDRVRLDEKIERATREIPRLRQRVAATQLSIAPPRWEPDPDFDLGFHVRTLRAPGDGSLRTLFDLAQPIAAQSFDRARPLWELVIVEGLAEGRAGLVLKLHHSLSDGVGLVQMTTSMVEGYRTPDPTRTKRPMPPVPEMHAMSQRERVLDALRWEEQRVLDRTRRSLGLLGRGVRGLVSDPVGLARDAADTVRSVGRLLRPTTEPQSPIMRGRSLRLRFDAFTASLSRAKAAARKADGRLNDAFVAGIAGGLGRYHRLHGAPASTLRMSMPINVRAGEKTNLAGNQFVPARFEVPLGIENPLERMRVMRDLVGGQRAEPALGLLDDLSGALNRLPTALSTPLFASMMKGVDFVTSNVPGPRTDVYLSGARLEHIFGFGPLAGAAVNVTLFSYRDDLGIAVNTDRAAVPDPEHLVECLQQGVEEVLATAD
jgi:WS/DGAT/MGAT family acyltransferase